MYVLATDLESNIFCACKKKVLRMVKGREKSLSTNKIRFRVCHGK